MEKKLILEDCLLWKHCFFPENKSIVLLLLNCVWLCLHFVDRLIQNSIFLRVTQWNSHSSENCPQTSDMNWKNAFDVVQIDLTQV